MKTIARLHYVEQGPPTGPAVIMLHGYSDSSFSFSRVLPLLPGSLRVIVPDQRGHGRSDRTAGDYSMDAMARDVIALMDSLSVPTATLVGHCMGSFVARRAAVLAPDRIERLVLVGGSDVFFSPAVRELQASVVALEDPVDRAFVHDFQCSTVQVPVPDEFMARVIDESLTLDAETWKELFIGMAGYEPAERDIRVPTLVIGGERDTVFSEAAQRSLARAIEGSHIEILPGIGHTPQWEVPQQFVERLLHFLDTRPALVHAQTGSGDRRG